MNSLSPTLSSPPRAVAWCALLWTLLLQGCGHTPVTRTLVDAFGEGKGVSSVVLSPGFRYLKVTAKGREALMVLGYVDSHPDGVIETWYSSLGEVLRLQNGRVLSTAGLETDWKSVRFHELPTWSALVGRTSVVFHRARDEMPGHRYGLKDRVRIYAVPPPEDAHLVGVNPKTLIWFEEKVEGEASATPSARYGVRLGAGVPPQPVYGEQCLSANFCLAWQTWPAKP
jgi:hypothetical protein